MTKKGFIQREIDLGFVRVNHSYDVKFPYVDITKIIETQASCDCIDMDNQPKNRRLVATWKPKAIPEHLKEQGAKHYVTQKSIKVKYTTLDSNEPQLVVLLFSAKVIE